MHWEKKICIRITLRRLVAAILAASTVVNLIIVGAVLVAAAPQDSPTMTETSTLTAVLAPPIGTMTFVVHTATIELLITSTPTNTPSATPTETLTATATPSIPPVWTACVKRFDWPVYQVRQGDTLFSIAVATGSTVQELMTANCLGNSWIYIGQFLYVPRLPANTHTPTSTNTSTPTHTPSVSPRATDTATATFTPTFRLTLRTTSTQTTITPSPGPIGVQSQP